MADQLTDSEAKMLRELAIRHYEDYGEHDIMAALSELLLAAKQRHLENTSIALYGHPNERSTNTMKALASSDWGDLFEVK